MSTHGRAAVVGGAVAAAALHYGLGHALASLAERATAVESPHRLPVLPSQRQPAESTTAPARRPVLR